MTEAGDCWERIPKSVNRFSDKMCVEIKYWGADLIQSDRNVL
ncbi:hypothetical protein CEV33_0460 [Brucella grignonensis]|uniref:Uncharacterized protein n=1 Tax=Brucella grignonensis TaxID=94627 RepID=A0A256FFS5_9HYPH|nr:hypothetical protein CEV33_0460 [Brucella grignonensis]